MKTNRILLAMDYASVLGGGGGGGGGYGGDISSKVSAGGTNRAAFGSINFGDNAKVGGTSAGDGSSSNTVLYVAIAAIVLVLLFKR